MSYQRVTPAEWERWIQHPAAARIPSGKSLSVLDAGSTEITTWAEIRHLDLYKNWDCLHYLLTGWSVFSQENDFGSPLSRILTGGGETTIPCGYGFVRFLMPGDVSALSEVLQDVHEDELRAGFWRNLPQSSEVYAFNGDEIELDTALTSFALVRAFFSHAAQAGDVILLSSD